MKALASVMLVLSILILPSCKKTTDLNPADSSDSDGLPPESSAPGFGNSKARPAGTLFAFPAGVTLVQKPLFDEDCWTEGLRNRKVKGSGGLVQFCLSLRNDNPYPVQVELPPGLIWIAETSTTFLDTPQNGIIIKTVVILIPAHSVERTWVLAYCINSDRSVTRSGDTYEAQPIVSNHPGIRALAQQMATKKINEDEFSPEPTQAERSQLAFVGVAVHEIESYGTVQPDTRKHLDQLPDLK